MAKGKKPGVMIYFETKHIVKHLDLEDIGRLFLAILDYAEENKPPNFSEEEDMTLCIAWDIIKPKIDSDSERYKERCENAVNAANKRWKDNK